MGLGSVVQSGGQPTSCQPPRKDNTYLSVAPRIDWDLGGDLTFTSLTEYQHFHREAAIDESGQAIQVYQSVQYGKIESEYQELRLAGKFSGKRSWLVGANYEHDYTLDRFLETLTPRTTAPSFCPIVPPTTARLPVVAQPLKVRS